MRCQRGSAFPSLQIGGSQHCKNFQGKSSKVNSNQKPKHPRPSSSRNAMRLNFSFLAILGINEYDKAMTLGGKI